MALKPRPAEWLLIGYAAVVVVVGTVRSARYPAAGWTAVGHGLVITLLLLLQSPRLGRVGRLTRDAAPILLLLALYGALDSLSGFGAVPTHDRVIQSVEMALFGGQPSQTLWQRYPSQLASSILHGAYFSYYLIVPFPIALFLWRRDRARFDRALFVVLLSFVVCYLIFLAFPVAGPYYEFVRPPSWFRDNLPARAVYRVLEGGSSYGAAFPSSHVAATWAAVAATTSGSRRLGGALAVAALLLTVGVVYCQMHYAVDAIAGLLVALIAVAIGFGIARDS